MLYIYIYVYYIYFFQCFLPVCRVLLRPVTPLSESTRGGVRGRGFIANAMPRVLAVAAHRIVRAAALALLHH